MERPPKEEDVFKAAEAWDLYRIMQIHRGQHMTQLECSRQFLLSFTDPRHHTQATELEISLASLVPTSMRARKTFVLPATWSVRNLATRLSKAAPICVDMTGVNRDTSPTLRYNAMATSRRSHATASRSDDSSQSSA